MYISLFVSFCVCVFMYRAAYSGRRGGWLWGLIALLWVTVLQQLFGDSLLIGFFGFLGAFITMTIANFINDPSTN